MHVGLSLQQLQAKYNIQKYFYGKYLQKKYFFSCKPWFTG
jgi:hypothetical protein